MRHTGILRSWHDDRGFGFVAPVHGGAELFVHVSAFPRDGTRPVVGERLSYELGRGKDGKPQAVNVTRSAVGAPPPPVAAARASARRDKRAGNGFRLLVLTVLIVAAGAFAFDHVRKSQRRSLLANEAPTPAAKAPAAGPGSYRCDGRTHCSQMTSCAEATWFIQHCPGTKMDGNRDGVPCEQQWCTSALSR